jgi:ABC-type transport system substrate-binding protein
MQWLYARDLMGFASNPKEASKVVPDLATAPGKANADFTESTYTLRDGLKYPGQVCGHQVRPRAGVRHRCDQWRPYTVLPAAAG